MFLSLECVGMMFKEFPESDAIVELRNKEAAFILSSFGEDRSACNAVLHGNL